LVNPPFGLPKQRSAHTKKTDDLIMKTPTLIVRLVGLYLLASCAVGIMQIGQMESLAGPVGVSTQQQSVVSHMQVYCVFGLIVGLAATAFAGPLARMLTFDSEPREAASDLADQLLKRKNEKSA
jgi:hypothetical protein